MTNAITILLVDDHAVLRAGLRALLNAEPDFEVVGEAASGEEALHQVRTLQPDVVVMDLSMPGIGGIETMRRIGALGLETRLLVLTAHAEEEFLFPVLEAGGSGYVNKASADRELTEAIRAVARGEVFLYPDAQRLLLDRYQRTRAGEPADPLDRLSSRERQVLGLTVEGYSATEIGEQLGLSSKTVDTYRARVMQKLELHHRAELVRFALRAGLLRAGEE